MIDKEKQKLNMKVQWTKFIAVLVLYLLFLVWVKSWLGLIVVPKVLFVMSSLMADYYAACLSCVAIGAIT